MLDTSWHEEVGGRVLTLQIIVGVLVAGLLTFLVIAVGLTQFGGMQPKNDLASVFNLVLGVCFVGALAARLIVPNIMVNQARRRIAAGTWSVQPGPNQQAMAQFAEFIERTGDAGRLMAVFQTRTIVAAAILEGVGFFAVTVFLMTQSMVGLVIAGIVILALLFHIPTRSGVIHWIEDQLQPLQQERPV